MNILIYSLTVIFFIQIFFFMLAALFKTDKVTDLAYGSTFALLSILYLDFEIQKIILTFMIFVWGIRLSSYLFIRIVNTGKDSRFDSIREKFFSFLGFWTLQAISIFIIMLPGLFFYSKTNPDFFSIGFVIWLIGFLIEAVSDHQKYRFKKKEKGFISSGLWRYSRHPNYFGEILCWIGVYVFVLPSLIAWENIGILSPIFITVLLVFISGIPILEKQHGLKYGKKYAEYKRKTSMLLPWPPKKLS